MAAAVALSEKVLSAKTIICDIEGTTTSISFVKDTLFPYALKNVEEYLKNNWNEDATKTVVAALREQAEEDKKAELEGTVTIPAGDSEDIIPDIVKNVEWQMSADRKTGSLKTLQGMIWNKGYKDGTIKGHVYGDVQSAFEQWTKGGRKIYIYSSGSVEAQKLLFEHSEQGNLLKYLTGHYDTKIGAKREKESYASILKQIEATGEDALFLTDVFAEAKAAKDAGLHVVLLDRPGNSVLTEDERKEFPVITSFGDLSFVAAKEEANGSTENGSAKRKIDETADAPEEEDQAQEPPSKVVKVEENKKPESAENGTKSDEPSAESSVAKTEPTEEKKVDTLSDKAEEMEVDGGESAKKSTCDGEKATEKMDEDALEKVSAEKKGEAMETEEKKEEPAAAEKSDIKISDPLKVEESNVKGPEAKVVPQDDVEMVAEKKENETEKAEKVVANDEKVQEQDGVEKPAEKEEKESEKQAKADEIEKKIEPAVAEKEKGAEDSVEKSEVDEKMKSEKENEASIKPEAQPSAESKPVNDTAIETTTAKEEIPETLKEESKAVEEITGEVETKSGPVDEVATEAKEEEKEAKNTADAVVGAEKTKGDTAEKNDKKEVADDPVTTNGGDEKTDDKTAETNGVAAAADEKSVTTTNGSSGVADEEKNGDSDKENDTSLNNCESDEATPAVEKTNGSSAAESTNTDDVTTTSEMKTKKVVEAVVPVVTPAPPIEAES